MDNKLIYIGLGVVLLGLIAWFIYDSKQNADNQGDAGGQQKGGQGLGSADNPLIVSGGIVDNPLWASAVGGGQSNEPSSEIIDIVGRYKTAIPFRKPNIFQDISLNLKDYVSQNGNKIDLKSFANWIRVFNLPKTWGMPNPLTGYTTVIPSPEAEIEITYVTSTNPVPQVRKYKYGQKIQIW